jgi:hypothetical protein
MVNRFLNFNGHCFGEAAPKRFMRVVLASPRA